MVNTNRLTAPFSGMAQHIRSNDTHEEGQLTQTVEKATARFPSMFYLSLAIGSMIASAGIEVFSNRKELGNFVGLWAPSFLLMGIYNKLVKLESSNRHSRLEGVLR